MILLSRRIVKEVTRSRQCGRKSELHGHFYVFLAPSHGPQSLRQLIEADGADFDRMRF